ncbi:MAG: 50S ribosomal protein L9 [Candidatus Doudnabacteria bacterium]|nr:50S ribosomal protein L9 [Candidatus Doudnabacteria bacterium]
MKLILFRDTKGLGKRGEIVEVSNGYARNYLIPKKMGVLATDEVIKSVEKQAGLRVKKEHELGKQAAKFAQKIGKKIFEFPLPADEKGHLYAGLKEAQILAKIREGIKLPFDLDAKLVDYLSLKTTGTHKVSLDLGGDVVQIDIVILAANEKRTKET